MINKVHHGDCLEVMKKIETGSVDMILCDLPYGTTICKWDSIIDFKKLWEQYNRVIKDNGAIVLTAQTPFDKTLAMSNLKMLRYEWIWEKSRATGFLNCKKMPLKSHENILVFYKKLPTYNPQGLKQLKEVQTLCKKSNSELYPVKHRPYEKKYINYPKSVLKFKSESKTKHPTQKPVKLFEYLIKTYTNHGEVILDNCLGSGTTAVAALNTGRKFIGIEMEQRFVDISNIRIKATKEKLKSR